jgi:hypothetical protein
MELATTTTCGFPRAFCSATSSADPLAILRATKSPLFFLNSHQPAGRPRTPLVRLMDTLVCEAITSVPKGTLRARGAAWVIRTFFVWAANNPVGHHGGARRVRLEEGQNLFPDPSIIANIRVALREPALEDIRIVTFREENTDNDLGGQSVVGPVEGYCDNGVALKSPADRIWPRSRFLLPDSLHRCNICHSPDGRKAATQLNHIRGVWTESSGMLDPGLYRGNICGVGSAVRNCCGTVVTVRSGYSLSFHTYRKLASLAVTTFRFAL